MQLNHNNTDLGCYIHWPYCAKICPYCDFTRRVDVEPPADAWLAACIKDLKKDIEWLDRKPNISTIFFGGGTPSMIPPKMIEKIIEEISKIANLDKGAEITLEANPTSSSKFVFEDFKKAGVNRISIGVQSFNDKILKFLGRDHSSLEAVKTIELGKTIFQNISFDLIYGLPGQNLSSWREDIVKALEFEVPHLSCYQLTIAKNTKFGHDLEAGTLATLNGAELANSIKELSEGLGADFYSLTRELCQAKNLEQYEISNYCRDHQRSRHNLLYWQSKEWLAIGASAQGRARKGQNKWQTSRTSNISKWLSGEKPERYKLSDKSSFHEKMIMGLRLKEGVNISHSQQKMIKEDIARNLENEGLLEIIEEKDYITLKIPQAKSVVCDAIIRAIVD